MTLKEWKAKHGVYTESDSAETIIAAKKTADRKLKGKSYCVFCAGGPFLISEMHLVPYEENPYVQMDDGTKVRRCDKCQKEKEAV